MQSLNKMATDLMLFSMPEFGFFRLPPSICTGSSIMPQKQNPDVLELVRANVHVVHGYLVTVNGLILNLPTGYNRDFQLAKEPMMKSLKIANDSLKIMAKLFGKLETDHRKLKTAMTPELYATEKAYKLVAQGIPFREAYQKVAEELKNAK
jgi:argininosuccinate lyase